MDLSDEGKAFSGTACYTTTFEIKDKDPSSKFTLDLGKVESFAKIKLNGNEVRTLWTFPYRADISKFLKKGENILEIEVTDTWFNRLVYDANLPEAERKTWTINAPHKDSPLRDSGLLGPVSITVEQPSH